MKFFSIKTVVYLFCSLLFSCSYFSGTRSEYEDPSDYLYKVKSDFNLISPDGRGLSLLKDSNSDFVLISFVQSKDLQRESLDLALKGLKNISDSLSGKKISIKLVVLDQKEDRDKLEKLELSKKSVQILIDNTQISGLDFGAVYSFDSYLLPRGHRAVVWKGNALVNNAASLDLVPQKHVAALDEKLKLLYDSFLVSEKVLTFEKDISPILIKNCISCHHTSGVAPWAMRSYDSIKRWRRMIREVVLTRRMPPAQSDSYYRTYLQDNSISTSEVQTLVKWIDQTSSETPGNDPLSGYIHEDAGPFSLGKPDYILEVPQQKIGADDREFITVLRMNWPLNTPARIKGMDVQTDNVKATHHLSIYYLVPNKDPNAKDMTVASFDGGYIPGYRPTFLPLDTSYLIPANAPIRVSPHVVPTGKDEIINMRVGFYFAKDTEPKELLHCGVDTKNISIPPNTKNHKLSTSGVLTEDVRVIQVGTHMHSRGKNIKYTAHLPNGKTEVLLSLPNYNRNWQREYIPQEPLFLPKGTKMECLAYFDNTKDNPFVSNPNIHVKYGWNADDEMLTCSCFAMREVDYQRTVLKKKIPYQPIPVTSDRIVIKQDESH
jgi:hypothetical protein